MENMQILQLEIFVNYLFLSVGFMQKRVTQRIGFHQVLDWPIIHLTPSGNKINGKYKALDKTRANLNFS